MADPAGAGQVEQCVAKDTVYINYGYNPEIKGGGKDTDASPLTAAGGGASIGESGHVMVGSDPTVVTLGAVYKRPVVVAGVPRYPPACRVGSESQTEGAECDEVVPRINIETGAAPLPTLGELWRGVLWWLRAAAARSLRS